MTTPDTTKHQDDNGKMRVVVGYDGSDSSIRALTFAVHEAAMRGALLHVVSAYDIPPSTGPAVVPVSPFADAAAANVTEALRRAHEIGPGIVTKGDHTFGWPGVVMTEACRGATLLVVGSRGHGEIASLVLGSISEYCVHHASCPVAVVH